jgi:hypothetical protein
MMKRTLVILALCAGWSGPVLADYSASDGRYDIHDNGTVSDQTTGLMWQRCLLGKSGADCTDGTARTFIGADALNAARGGEFAGIYDWRLPKVEELKSLIATCANGLQINRAAFSNAEPAIVKSVSYGGDYATDVWVVKFADGTSMVEDEDKLRPIRLVRDIK